MSVVHVTFKLLRSQCPTWHPLWPVPLSGSLNGPDPPPRACTVQAARCTHARARAHARTCARTYAQAWVPIRIGDEEGTPLDEACCRNDIALMPACHPAPMRVIMHARTHARTYAITPTHLPLCTPAHAHIHARAHTHARTHTRTHTHIHARAHTHTYTHARAHTHRVRTHARPVYLGAMVQCI